MKIGLVLFIVAALSPKLAFSWGGDGGGSGGCCDKVEGWGTTGSGGTGGCCAELRSASNYIKALAEKDANSANQLLVQLQRKPIRQLENERDLGIICQQNDCLGLREQMAAKVLDNALRDVERNAERVRNEESRRYTWASLIIAGLGLIAAFIAVWLGRIANKLAHEANALAVRADERSLQNAAAIEDLKGEKET